jgi:hypothetical protein
VVCGGVGWCVGVCGGVWWRWCVVVCDGGGGVWWSVRWWSLRWWMSTTSFIVNIHTNEGAQ